MNERMNVVAVGGAGRLGIKFKINTCVHSCARVEIEKCLIMGIMYS